MGPTPYRAHILDHYQNPRHRGRLEEPDRAGEADNPVCGDRVRITLNLDEGNRVVGVAFEGDGCVVSQAAASMLAEHVHGRALEEVRSISDQDLLSMLGGGLSRARTQCALVSLQALRAALSGPR